jgi:hypothetical protein
MTEAFLGLSAAEHTEALQVAASTSGRPLHVRLGRLDAISPLRVSLWETSRLQRGYITIESLQGH